MLVPAALNGIVIFFLSVLAGYVVFLYLSHPDKKKNKVPHLRIGNIEILPNLKIHFRNKTYHVHHWLLLSILTAFVLSSVEWLNHLMMLKGVAIGGILQGLRYPDRFKFRHPRNKMYD